VKRRAVAEPRPRRLSFRGKAGALGLLAATLLSALFTTTVRAQDAVNRDVPFKAVIVDLFTFINETRDFTKQKYVCWLEQGTRVEVLSQAPVFGGGPHGASEVRALEGMCSDRKGWTSTSRLRPEP
jgi:hypothetical protein